MENKNIIQNQKREQPDYLDSFVDSLCEKGTASEKILFKEVCKRTGLNPLLRQIYPVFRYNGKTGKFSMTIQTSIDGYRSIADRTQKYSPGKEVSYHYDDKGNLLYAVAYVKKMTPDGTWHEIAGTAYWDEYKQTNKDHGLTSFWEKMPHVMLGKCAEAQALRKAFPCELSNIYTNDEMMQATFDSIKVSVADNEDGAQEQALAEKKTGTNFKDSVNELDTLAPQEASELEGLVGADPELGDRILEGYSSKYGKKFVSFYELPKKEFGAIKNRIALLKNPKPIERR